MYTLVLESDRRTVYLNQEGNDRVVYLFQELMDGVRHRQKTCEPSRWALTWVDDLEDCLNRLRQCGATKVHELVATGEHYRDCIEYVATALAAKRR